MKLLITGTSRGIGKYLASQYLARGHTVYGISRTSPDLQGDYTHIFEDLTDFDKIRIPKGIDVLINNAGRASMNHALLTPTETIRQIMDLNYTATFVMCREAAKRKVKRIINFSTIAVPLNLEGEAAYASSKAAVEQLTKILAREFAEFGITVNAVGPSLIKTALTDRVPKKKLQAIINRQAKKRWADMGDVFQVVDFFINASDMVTGQTIYLGGL